MDNFVSSNAIFRLVLLRNKLPNLYREVVKFSTARVLVAELEIPPFLSIKQLESAVQHPSKIILHALEVLYYLDQGMKTEAKKRAVLEKYTNLVMVAIEIADKLRNEYQESLNEGTDENLLKSDLEILRDVGKKLSKISKNLEQILGWLDEIVNSCDKEWYQNKTSYINKAEKILLNYAQQSINLNELEKASLLEDNPAIIASKMEILSAMKLPCEGWSDLHINLYTSLLDYQARNVGIQLNIDAIIEELSSIFKEYEQEIIAIEKNNLEKFQAETEKIRNYINQVNELKLLSSDDVQRIQNTQLLYQRRLNTLTVEKEEKPSEEDKIRYED